MDRDLPPLVVARRDTGNTARAGRLTLSLADRDGDGRMGHRAMIEGIGHRALGMLGLQFLLQVGRGVCSGCKGSCPTDGAF